MGSRSAVPALLLACCSVWAAAPLPTVTYQLGTPGTVSVGIYDSAGTLVRHLLTGEPAEARTHAVTWDGRDDSGVLLDPGDYTYRGIVANVRAEWVEHKGNSERHMMVPSRKARKWMPHKISFPRSRQEYASLRVSARFQGHRSLPYIPVPRKKPPHGSGPPDYKFHGAEPLTLCEPDWKSRLSHRDGE